MAYSEMRQEQALRKARGIIAERVAIAHQEATGKNLSISQKYEKVDELPEQVQELAENLFRKNFTPAPKITPVFTPDAGFAQNPRVYNPLKKAVSYLETKGYNAKLLCWEQFFKCQKYQEAFLGDVDEISFDLSNFLKSNSTKLIKVDEIDKYIESAELAEELARDSEANSETLGFASQNGYSTLVTQERWMSNVLHWGKREFRTGLISVQGGMGIGKTEAMRGLPDLMAAEDLEDSMLLASTIQRLQDYGVPVDVGYLLANLSVEKQYLAWWWGEKQTTNYKRPCVLIGYRIGLIEQTCDVIGLKFRNELKSAGYGVSLKDNPYMALCYDSLLDLKVEDFYGATIILDEVVAGLNHLFYGETCAKKRHLLADHFIKILHYAVSTGGRINNADAGFDVTTLEAIETLFSNWGYLSSGYRVPLEKKFIQNTLVPEDRRYTINFVPGMSFKSGSVNEYSSAPVKEAFGEAVGSHLSILMIDSLNEAHGIDRWLQAKYPGKKGLLITSKTDSDLKHSFMRDPEGLLREAHSTEVEVKSNPNKFLSWVKRTIEQQRKEKKEIPTEERLPIASGWLSAFMIRSECKDLNGIDWEEFATFLNSLNPQQQPPTEKVEGIQLELLEEKQEKAIAVPTEKEDKTKIWTRDEVKDQIQQAISQYLDYFSISWIICTQVVESGTSITGQYIKEVFGIFTGTACPDAAFQMLGRVRWNGAPRTVFAPPTVKLSGACKPENLTKQKISHLKSEQKNLQEAQKNYMETCELLDVMATLDRFDDKLKKKQAEINLGEARKSIINIVTSKLKIKADREKFNYSQEILKRLENAQYHITVRPREGDQDVLTEIKNHKEDYLWEESELTYNAARIPFAQAQAFADSTASANPDIRRAIDRAYLLHQLNDREDLMSTETIYNLKLHKRGQALKIAQNYVNFNNPELLKDKTSQQYLYQLGRNSLYLSPELKKTNTGDICLYDASMNVQKINAMHQLGLSLFAHDSVHSTEEILSWLDACEQRKNGRYRYILGIWFNLEEDFENGDEIEVMKKVLKGLNKVLGAIGLKLVICDEDQYKVVFDNAYDEEKNRGIPEDQWLPIVEAVEARLKVSASEAREEISNLILKENTIFAKQQT